MTIKEYERERERETHWIAFMILNPKLTINKLELHNGSG